MKPVEIEVTINAPLERIYAMAVDIENTPKVFPQIVRVEMLNTPRDAARPRVRWWTGPKWSRGNKRVLGRSWEPSISRRRGGAGTIGRGSHG
jgi:uncharacterized membrane protein